MSRNATTFPEGLLDAELFGTARNRFQLHRLRRRLDLSDDELAP